MKILPFDGSAFLAFPDSAKKILDELNFRNIPFEEYEVFGDLLLFPKKMDLPRVPYWCKCQFRNPEILEFSSISEGANSLKQMMRNWGDYQSGNFRRSALIAEKLPYVNRKPRQFPFEIPKSEMGIWTLLSPEKILFSRETSAPLPAGHLEFIENHVDPPSRAYLKLQEALTLFQYHFNDFPCRDSLCFDGGACPGGWSYVLLNLGCKVTACDRSPLDARLMKNPNLNFVTHDAFTLPIDEISRYRWIFSDVICYPNRLYQWVRSILEKNPAVNMICTVKMQGETDFAAADEFSKIPNSKVLHLNYNKHELTFMHKG
ncbi:MAG: SAM-dependent methyltransferase [Spirochaetaceae bacterium]|nr:SAM-dependent methyltransferase [Spirochaetaceae bacterium]